MSIEVKIPALGESISSGVLSSWKVAEGSYVEIDQPIYELETDKITQEGLAEVAGVISFLAKEGEEVEIGATIAQIDDSAEKPAGDAAPAEKSEESPVEEAEADPKPDKPDEPAEAPEEKEEPSPPPVPEEAKSPAPAPVHSPAVRKALAETGIDPATLSGTGKDGRLTKADVLAVSKNQATPPPAAPPADAKPKPVPVASPDKQAAGRSTRRALSPIRR